MLAARRTEDSPHEATPTKDEVAEQLAQGHYAIDSGLANIFRVVGPPEREADPDEPIKLLEVYEYAIPERARPDPLPAASAERPGLPAEIVQIAPEEFERLQAHDFGCPTAGGSSSSIPGRSRRKTRGHDRRERYAWAFFRQAHADFATFSRLGTMGTCRSAIASTSSRWPREALEGLPAAARGSRSGGPDFEPRPHRGTPSPLSSARFIGGRRHVRSGTTRPFMRRVTHLARQIELLARRSTTTGGVPTIASIPGKPPMGMSSSRRISPSRISSMPLRIPSGSSSSGLILPSVFSGPIRTLRARPHERQPPSTPSASPCPRRATCTTASSSCSRRPATRSAAPATGSTRRPSAGTRASTSSS